jgi:tetratricopeptide (TPR) repeat protein
MSDPASDNHLARCEQLLKEAEAYERAGDWESAVGKYRVLNALDHLYKGAEAKLLFALTERDAGKLYNEGKAHLNAGRYAEALDAFRKAKVRAGVYRDTNALIKECERILAGGSDLPATAAPTTKRGCLVVLLAFFA